MKRILNLVVIVISFLTCQVMAQDNKDRGNTDYTNNRTAGKPKNDNRVNTQKKTPVKIIEYIPGVWTIDKVYQGKKDITANDTIAQNQTMEFTREAKFMSYQGNEKIDSGTFRVNEDHAILYLASESNTKPTEWNVWFDPKGTMTLKMIDADKKSESIRYVYRRTSNVTSSKR